MAVTSAYLHIVVDEEDVVEFEKHRIEVPVGEDFPYDHPLPTKGVSVGKRRGWR